jgi:ERCC4-type nuclease
MTEEGNKEGTAVQGASSASSPAGQAEAFSCLDFLMGVPGVGRTLAENIVAKGITTKDDLARLTYDDLVQMQGVSGPMAERILAKISKDLPKPAAAPEGKEGPVIFKIKDEAKPKEGAESPPGEGKTEVEGVTIEPCAQKEGEDKAKAGPEEKKEEKPAKTPKAEEKKEPGFFQRLMAPLANIFKKKPQEAQAKKEPEIKVEVQEKDTTVIELKGEDFTTIPGVTSEIAGRLRQAGYQNISELKEAIAEDLTMIEGIDEATAKAIITALHP